MTSPTQRSLKLLRDEGYLCAVVEKWNPHAKIRQDLFGVIDILGIRAAGVIAVQTTSLSNIASRIEKVETNPNLWLMLNAGWDVEVHGWAKKGAKGKRKLWECKRVIIGNTALTHAGGIP